MPGGGPNACLRHPLVLPGKYAGYEEDACAGDSGGPLFLKRGAAAASRDVVMGVVNEGRECYSVWSGDVAGKPGGPRVAPASSCRLLQAAHPCVCRAATVWASPGGGAGKQLQRRGSCAPGGPRFTGCRATSVQVSTLTWLI